MKAFSLVSLTLAFAATFLTMPASVQASGPSGGAVDCRGDTDLSCWISSTTTYGSLTLVVITSEITSEASGSSSQRGMLEQYVKANEVHLMQDLHVGGGETLEDIASMYRVEAEDRARFFAYLHDTRAVMLSLMLTREDDARWEEMHQHLIAHAVAG